MTDIGGGLVGSGQGLVKCNYNMRQVRMEIKVPGTQKKRSQAGCNMEEKEGGLVQRVGMQ